MGDRSLGSVSGVIYHQTFNILATENSTSTSPGNLTAKFNPSMAIIIIVLISAFLFMGFFSIYVRRCTTSDDNQSRNTAQQRPGNPNVSAPGQGLDKSVVENLPLVGFSLVKGLKGGKDLSECAVCLSEFEEDENLRLLPKCGHIFHPDCIDMWFFSHVTCPLCRASLVPDPESGKETESYSGELQAFLNPGDGSDPVPVTIHDGPPVPPNGSILELLSREGAERILAESLRWDGERLDPGLARREGDDNGGRAQEIRALNRALSKNSASFRKASRGVEVIERIGAATDSGRFNPVSVAGVVDANGNPMGSAFFEKRERKAVRSVGASSSFNMALRRSSSVGSSGRYIRQLFSGNYTDYFSPDSEHDGLRVDRTKLLGTQHRLPVTGTVRRERNEQELQTLGRVEIPVWDNIDLNAETQTPNKSRELPHWTKGNYLGSGRRNFLSGELPPIAGSKRVDLQGEASGPLFMRTKGKESVEAKPKSEQWTFGQSLRRTFSLRRSNSDLRDGNTIEANISTSQPNDQAKWYSYMIPGSSAPFPRPRKYPSPWVGASKMRRTMSQDGVATSPTSQRQHPSSSLYPESLPVQDHQQQQHEAPVHNESIQIVTQP